MTDPNPPSAQTHIAQLQEAHFPLQINERIKATNVDLDTFFSASAELDLQLFPAHPHQFEMPTERHQDKAALYMLQSNTHQESVFFYDEDKPIGYCVGRMLGAHDFMLSLSGILPDYRNQGIYTAFLRHFVSYLAAVGYERVVSFNAPDHAAALIPKLRVGFVIGGSTYDDEFGARVKMVYYCHPDRRQSFKTANNLPAI